MKKKRQAGSERGVAMFMIITAVAILSILMAELTYSTKVNIRIAYNFVDNLKTFYLVKAGFKLSLLRLNAYAQVSDFLNNKKNDKIKSALPADIINKIWDFPFMYPIPVLENFTLNQKDEIKKFTKESKLKGAYSAIITGESSKMNLNNLFIQKVEKEKKEEEKNKSKSKDEKDEFDKVNFKKALEDMLTQLIENKKRNDREFEETYRNVEGKDVSDAIIAYVIPNSPPSTLPGWDEDKVKHAPFYSVSELHMVPGIDDGLYKLMEPELTVYSTPGINVNKASKELLHSLLPELTEEDMEDLMQKRDDPDVGKPWSDEAAFWADVQNTSSSKNIDDIKKRFKDGNLKIITTEQSFKISVAGQHGMSTKRLEAFVILSKKEKKKKKNDKKLPDNPDQQPPEPTSDGASSKKKERLNLIYWRMI